EGGRALAEAFADIGTRGLFTDRVQLVFAQNALDVVKARARRSRLDADPLGLFEPLGGDDLDGNARGLGLRFLFLAWIVARCSACRFVGGGPIEGCGHTCSRGTKPAASRSTSGRAGRPHYERARTDKHNMRRA